MSDHLDDLKSVSAAWKRAQRLGAEAEKRRRPPVGLKEAQRAYNEMATDLHQRGYVVRGCRSGNWKVA
jgi:hypothetical protein